MAKQSVLTRPGTERTPHPNRVATLVRASVTVLCLVAISDGCTSGVDTRLAAQPFGLLVRPHGAGDVASLALGDLTNDRTDGTGRRRHEDRLALFRLVRLPDLGRAAHARRDRRPHRRALAGAHGGRVLDVGP